jgi:hypothetical protein
VIAVPLTVSIHVFWVFSRRKEERPKRGKAGGKKGAGADEVKLS